MTSCQLRPKTNLFHLDAPLQEMVLRAKLTILPLRPNLVPRPRLFEQLKRVLQLGHKLTLVWEGSAIPGFQACN